MIKKSITKIEVFFFIFILLGTSFFSGFNNVSSFLENVYSSEEYTLVLGGKISSLEVASCAEFAGVFKIKNSKMDSETNLEEEKLILVGNSNNNSLVKLLIGEWILNSGEALVKIYNYSNSYFLIIAGTNSADTVNAINKLKEHQSYVNFSKYSELKIVGNSILGIDNFAEEIKTPPSNEEDNEDSPVAGGGGGGGGGGGSVQDPATTSDSIVPTDGETIVPNSEVTNNIDIRSPVTEERNEEEIRADESEDANKKVSEGNEIGSKKIYFYTVITIGILMGALLLIYITKIISNH